MVQVAFVTTSIRSLGMADRCVCAAAGGGATDDGAGAGAGLDVLVAALAPTVAATNGAATTGKQLTTAQAELYDARHKVDWLARLIVVGVLQQVVEVDVIQMSQPSGSGGSFCTMQSEVATIVSQPGRQGRQGQPNAHQREAEALLRQTRRRSALLCARRGRIGGASEEAAPQHWWRCRRANIIWRQ